MVKKVRKIRTTEPAKAFEILFIIESSIVVEADSVDEALEKFESLQSDDFNCHNLVGAAEVQSCSEIEKM